MSQSNSRPQLSEKGLLTPDNCVVAVIDLQPQMLFGVGGADREAIVNHNVALSKAARVFDVPVVLSTVESRASAVSCGRRSRRSSPAGCPSNVRR